MSVVVFFSHSPCSCFDLILEGLFQVAKLLCLRLEVTSKHFISFQNYILCAIESKGSRKKHFIHLHRFSSFVLVDGRNTCLDRAMGSGSYYIVIYTLRNQL